MKILVTGGAGFIGSHISEQLLRDKRVDKVRVLDNLSTGSIQNFSSFHTDKKFEFVEGDIRDRKTCRQAVRGMDKICHQAALGSVPRSVEDPQATHDVNATGTLNIFEAARQEDIKRVVFASSSAVYGDEMTLPKVEEKTGKPLSPYAVSKKTNELYAQVYGDLYGMEMIGFRYFNVFGPRQSPKGPYAAVIPIFIKAASEGKPAVINGDGSTTRDFTFIQNVVDINITALFTEKKMAVNEVYNIAVGEKTSLNELWRMICEANGKYIEPIHGPERPGDIKESLADLSKSKEKLDYRPVYTIKETIHNLV